MRFGSPIDISLHGHRVDWLFEVTTWMVLFLFLIVVFVLVWSMIRFREGRVEKAHYDLGNTKKNTLLTILIVIAIFIIVDGNLHMNSYKDMREVIYNHPKSEESLRVQIMPQQWAWNIRYAGQDNQFNTADDIVTLNELRVPVNKPIDVQLRSKDVIHSFFLPHFRMKQDANPGSVTKTWFQATKTGDFEIVCAELCGYAHYQMRGALKVLEPQEFEKWQQEMQFWAKTSYDAEDTEVLWGWNWEQK